MENTISKSVLSLLLSKIINGAELLIKEELDESSGKLTAISFTIVKNKLLCHAKYEGNQNNFGNIDITQYLPEEFDFNKNTKIEFKEMVKKRLKDKKHVD